MASVRPYKVTAGAQQFVVFAAHPNRAIAAVVNKLAFGIKAEHMTSAEAFAAGRNGTPVIDTKETDDPNPSQTLATEPQGSLELVTQGEQPSDAPLSTQTTDEPMPASMAGLSPEPIPVGEATEDRAPAEEPRHKSRHRR